jgi:hypothetical protein
VLIFFAVLQAVIEALDHTPLLISPIATKVSLNQWSMVQPHLPDNAFITGSTGSTLATY